MGLSLPVRGCFLRVFVAVTAVAVAVLARMAFLDILGPRAPFLTFYPAVMLAALCGGLLSGLLSTGLLSVLAYAWVLPRSPSGELEGAGWLAIAVFLLGGALVSGMAEALHRARLRAAAAEVQAAVAEERCQADAALRRLAAIVDASDDAIIGAELDGTVTHWSRGAERIYGYAAEEVLGRSGSMLCPPGRKGEMAEMTARLIGGESVQHFETVRQRKDGALVDVSVTLSAIRGADGVPSGVSAVVRDITERKRAEAALRESRRRATELAEMLESSSQAFAVGYADGRVGLFNAAFAELLGYDRSEMAGLDWARGITPPEWAKLEREKLAELTRTGQPVRYEKEYLRRDGSRVPVELHVNQRLDAEGRAEYYYAFITDITERKEIEETQRFLLQCGGSAQGEDFFLSLARYLAQKLDMDFVCIDRLEGDGLTARTLAAYFDGTFEDNISYALKDTPCGDVVGQNVCCIPGRVRHLYPKDQILQDMNAESYVGVTLWDAHARAIGLIAVIGRRPLANARRAETLLQLVGLRAAGELENRKALEALTESEAFSRAIIESSPDCIKLLNGAGELTYMSPGGQRLLELDSAEQVLGRQYLDFWQGSDHDLAAAAFQTARAGRLGRFQGFCPTVGGTPKWWDVSIAPMFDQPASGAALAGGEGHVGQFLAVSRDDTARKLATDALGVERERLSAIIDTSGDLMYLKDPELRYLAVNKAHESIMGLRPQDMLGRTDFEVLPPELAESCRKSDLAALRDGVVDQEERFGGSWFHVSKRRVEDPSGKVLGLAARISDITERKEAEEARRASEQRLLFSQQIAMLGQWEFDLAANSLRWCPSVFKMFEIDPAQAAPSYEHFLALVHPDDRDAVHRAFFDSLEARKPYSIIHRLRTPDGRVKWLKEACRHELDEDGNPVRSLGIVQDITELKQAEEALRESEELFRQLVERAPDAIFLQTGGRFAYVNQASLKLYGAPSAEAMLGSPVLSRLHPDCHARAAERMRLVNEERLPQPPQEQRHLRFDGGEIEVEVSAVPLVYGGENGALVFVHDVTERRRVQTLREDMERIARHDLKGPLNAVINLPLLYQDDPNLTKDQGEALRLIHQAGLRMLEQIDQSLTLYRIETGSFELSPHPVDLTVLTGQVAAEQNSLASALGVDLRVEADPEPLVITGDGLLCRTMFSNLLKNALEAAPRGGAATVRLAAREGHAEWSVHNAGAVPEAMQARFFEKYATYGKSRGVGLGAYSARLSAEAQGGSVGMRTSEAEGTTVTVRLPLRG